MQMAARLVREDIFEALTLVDRKRINEQFEWYLVNVAASVRKEKIQPGTYGNVVVREPTEPDERKMRCEFEEIWDVHDGRKMQFRSQLLSIRGSFSLGSQRPGVPIIEQAFPDLFRDILRQARLDVINGGGTNNLSPSRAVSEFLQDFSLYDRDETLAVLHGRTGEKTEKRARRWREGVARLVQKGYPRDEIGRIAHWAFNTDLFSEAVDYLS